MDRFGFPAWISATHFLNILFMTFLARSGIQVLASFPRLWLRDDCMPGKEIVRFTRKKPPAGTIWTSLDEEVDAPSWLALPGGRGAKGGLGIGRHWHFLSLAFWVVTGVIYMVLLFTTGQWQRLVPTSWSIFPNAVAAAGSYLHLRLAAPIPGYPYNGLQQLSYFAVVFILAPLQIATGAAMSPAVMARFPWYPSLFGGKQSARSLHFVGLVAFALFVVAHTAMVVVHGIPEEWTRIVLSTANGNQGLAVVVGLVGLGIILAANVAATWFGRRHPRQAQRLLGNVVDPFQRELSYHLQSRQDYKPGDITPYFWVNGRPPPDGTYQRLTRDAFAGWRLYVSGEVERPLELTLDDLRAMERASYITKHNCIQGWSAVGRWTGVPLSAFIDRCRPKPAARYVVFHAFDDKSQTQPGDGEGCYYETLDLKLARGPQALLAYELNSKPLPIEHGAPLRVRVETQLGFKMVKWIRAVEFAGEYRCVGLGQGGWREDFAYYSRVVGI